MGRKRKSDKNLPERVYVRRGKYYFVDKSGKWNPLGSEFHEAMVEYSRLNTTKAPVITMGQIMDRYLREVLPQKALTTQKKQVQELGLLRSVFGEMEPDDIQPKHIYGYMDRRARVRGNREKSLLSHVFTYAIRWGLATDNPCRLVTRNKEAPRKRYITDEEFLAVRAIMPPVYQCAMDLAYATGLRQSDILNLKWNDWSEDVGLTVLTGKTKKSLVFEPTPALRTIMASLKALPSKVSPMWVVHKRDGSPFTGDGFRAPWQRYMRKAIEEGVLTERFTFNDIRAKAASDGDDDRLLGHENPATLHRHYKRAPVRVRPVERKGGGKE
ncbi:tyrosine-type recombinase/integrase [Thioalkalivibrio sp. ALMg11]|uniref:tyrosine-type recombinase/integrase n=1 Tax=Thioalkalivibrio sp. ALMg11 TaxID=1158165 RepID=UPI00035C4798|nr:tyrosine-type recombinase/integrase [Thioalkalivibrio sp. ALMg11]